jgi:SNF2 family DNA or RNA helicase
MCDEDIISKVASIFGTKYKSSPPRKQNYKRTYYTKIQGKNAVKLMRELRPFMGDRRKKQIDKAISSYLSNRRQKLTEENLSQIKPFYRTEI